jgi:hypothetical protein
MSVKKNGENERKQRNVFSEVRGTKTIPQFFRGNKGERKYIERVIVKMYRKNVEGGGYL